MKYTGIDTKTLIDKSSKRLLFYIFCGFTVEGVGYVFYRYFDFYLMKFIAGFMFVLVIAFCVLAFIERDFPHTLKYIHGRDDVPERFFESHSWIDTCEIVVGILGIVLTSITLIIELFKQ